MSHWIGAFLLLSGAALCLLAAVGVLRLQDFFMRVHAATKAGVAGSGLVLLGVAALDGSLATWVKALLAVLFLLLTTPVAGHLIGRAGYVSGLPLWSGTRKDALRGVLARGRFRGTAEDVPPIARVVLALAEGPHMDGAIERAVKLAHQHQVELCGIALVDIPRLMNVGPVPIGAGWHAQQMRERRIAQARAAAADVLQRFEHAARSAGIVWSSRFVEGRPRRVRRESCREDDLLLVAADGWFDQGVLGLRPDVASRISWAGFHPMQVLH